MHARCPWDLSLTDSCCKPQLLKALPSASTALQALPPPTWKPLSRAAVLKSSATRLKSTTLMST
jgi:hypothetical protein